MDRLIGILVLAAGCGALMGQVAAPGPPPGDVANLVVKVNHPAEAGGCLGGGIVAGVGPGRVYVVTAGHVVRKGGKAIPDLAVEFKFRPHEPVKAKLLEEFLPAMDLAVIVISGLEAQGVPLDQWNFKRLGDSGALKAGDALYSIGHPQGKSWIKSSEPGRFSRRVAASLYFDWTSVVEGLSGGALVNQNGELIGMIVNDQAAAAEALTMEAILENVRDRGYPVSLERPSTIDISGRWINDQIDTNFPVSMEFVSDGKSVFGTVWELEVLQGSRFKSYGVQNGKTDGKSISFSLQERYVIKPGAFDPSTRTSTHDEYGYYEVTYQGEIVSPDQIRFVYQDRERHIQFMVRRMTDLTRQRSGNAGDSQYRRIYTLAGHENGVNSLAFAESSDAVLVSGGREDGQVKFWRVKSAELRWTRFADPRQIPGAVAVVDWDDPYYTVLGSYFVPKSHDRLRTQKWILFRLSSSLRGEDETDMTAEAYAAGQGGALAVVDGGDLSLRRSSEKVTVAVGQRPTALALGEPPSRSDEHLVAAAEAGPGGGSGLTVRRVVLGHTGSKPVNTVETIWSINLERPVNKLAFTPKAAGLIAADPETGELKLRASTDGRAMLTISPELGLGTPAFAFDEKGSVLAVGTTSSSLIKIWRLPSGDLSQTLDAGGPVCALAFTDDARLLASGDCKSGAIQMWARPAAE